MSMTRVILGVGLAAAAALLTGGCPVGTLPPQEFILGSSGDVAQIGNQASVVVLSPGSNLSLTGGTPVEVNWRAVATTRTAVIDVFFDVDQNPNNDNETIGESNAPITQTTALLDTTSLAAGDYFVGVRIEELARSSRPTMRPASLRSTSARRSFSPRHATTSHLTARTA